MKAIRTFTVRPVLAESLAPLDSLAANFRWRPGGDSGPFFILARRCQNKLDGGRERRHLAGDLVL